MSTDGIPEVSLTFPDGSEDSLQLKHAFDEATCAYRGRLRNDPKACVAVTGCAGQDPLDITIAGKTGGLFQLGLDGVTEDAAHRMERDDNEEHHDDEDEGNMSTPFPPFPHKPRRNR